VDDLVAFLLARLAEYEQAALETTRGTSPVGVWVADGREVCSPLRRIVQLHAGDHECSTFNDTIGDFDNCAWVIDGDCSTMRLLALLWRDHPDYNPGWDEPTWKTEP
jgi:Family of unknown function (DUF6221)